MSEGRKRGFFGSLFASKHKMEEELQADKEARQKVEERIREVLAVNDIPALPGLDQEPSFQANPGLLEIVYSAPDPAHPRPSLQSDQLNIHVPMHESDSNLRISPAKDPFRLDPALSDLQAEPWSFRQKAVNS